ncbi:uncharacterized protein N7500_006691 [Penicillium coprophilum]|uniref:uncharacterized protein n=1 Tax=Penicillium coprophilum TaxID=36646 RepID=UPI002388ABC5|nr:uncharacterized protein N7500_006691 [Penicillium coprophilum]KAJ5164861.1 hypothetical protein N7500_006691 [Penicillium coprophilum]
MEAKEQGLYNHPDDDFRYGMGRFFKILPTRPYMHARLGYRAALTFVRNVESVQVQLENLMENLRLCRSDNVRSKDMVPGVMIRLKKDQECYNFLKWWATSAKDPQYNWGDQTLPYLDIRNANPLEPIGAFIAYENATEKNRKLMDGMMELKDSTITRNPHVANLTCLQAEPEIAKMKAQIRQLYHIVNQANSHFWPQLLDPDENLNAAPVMYAPGSKEEMQAAIIQTWQAWNETFVALHVIHAIVNGEEF